MIELKIERLEFLLICAPHTKRLFPVLATGSFGADVVAVNGPGVVPTVLGAGVTGTLMTAVLLGAVLLIGPGVLQETV